jgi:hypothetical protein
MRNDRRKASEMEESTLDMIQCRLVVAPEEFNTSVLLDVALKQLFPLI